MNPSRAVQLILIAPVLFVLVGCATERKPYEIPYPNEKAELVSFQPGSEPYGLGGIAWGTDLSILQGMEHYRSDKSHGGIDFYIRKGEALRIGGETFERVQYGFWKGKFYVGMIRVDGQARWNTLKKAIFTHYGEGAKPFRNREEYLWTGEDVTMALRWNPDTETGRFYIRSESLRHQMTPEEKIEKYPRTFQLK